MKIEYKGQMVEAYDLILKKEFAEQIINGTKTIEIRESSSFYEKKFFDQTIVKANEKAIKEGRKEDVKDAFKNCEFIHFRDYGTFSLDVRIDCIGLEYLTKDSIEYLGNTFGFHDYDDQWQAFEGKEDEAPAFFYLHVCEIIRHDGVR